MVRTLGVSEYGIVVFIGSIITILESFVDFGVSSAAGKNIAAARESPTAALRAEVLSWARLQMMVASIGLPPLLALTYLIAARSGEIALNLYLVVILVLAAWITISLNFVRASLTSLLAFKGLAALDTFESILRSASYVAVAYLAPSSLGLAIAMLGTAVASSALGIGILWWLTGRISQPSTSGGLEPHRLGIVSQTPYMMKESVSFLWLRLATRAFQSIPLIMFGRFFGPDVVGIVGAIARVVELFTFPFSVIGNALAVRANGVVVKGVTAVQALWDAASRFLVGALMLSATFYLGANIVAHALLKDRQQEEALVAILSITVATTAVSALIGPMSDYVGALRSRNTLLTVFSFLQIPLIWIGASTGGIKGAIAAYVTVLALMNCGYVLIALKAFFPANHYRPRFEVGYFLPIAAAAVLLALCLQKTPVLDTLQPLNAAFLHIAIFWSLVVVGLMSHSRARSFFFSSNFFDFQNSLR